MKLVYTDGAIESLIEAIAFSAKKVTLDRAEEIMAAVLDEADLLLAFPFAGKPEEHFDHKGQGHRSLSIKRRYRIIYLVTDDAIIITDIFDMRQHPSRMKG